MPAAYAHYTFGRSCIEGMPEELKALCLKYRNIYDFGVHGPDVLFYYHPLNKNEVNTVGSQMHHYSGGDFFEKCKGAFDKFPEKECMTVYLLGFLAHFTLDSTCHGYINEMDRLSAYSHNFIESQYEAFLMKRDGKDPCKVDRSESLHPAKNIGIVISHFFPLAPDKIYRALEGQRLTMKLLYSPTQIKKKLLRRLIRTLHIGGSFDDLFLDREEVAECRPINEKILELQGEALKRYPGLMENLLSYLHGDSVLSDYYYEHDFEGDIIK